MRGNAAIHELSQFVSSHTEVTLLQEDPEQSSWACALTSDRSRAAISNLVASKRSSHPSACMQIPHAKRTQCTTHDIQGSSAYNVSNRCVEVKEGNAPEIPVVPLPPGPLPSLKLHHTARAALPSRLNGHFYIAISHLFFSPY